MKTQETLMASAHSAEATADRVEALIHEVFEDICNLAGVRLESLSPDSEIPERTKDQLAYVASHLIIGFDEEDFIKQTLV